MIFHSPFFYSLSITSRRRRRCPGFSVAFTPRELCVVVSGKVSENRKNTECWCMWWRKMSEKSETTHNKERETWLHFTSVTMYIVVASNVCNCRHTILWAVYADAPHFYFSLFPFPHIQIDLSSIVQSRWQPHGDSPAHTWWMCALCGDKLSWAHCKMLVLVQVEWFVLFDGDYRGIPISLEHHKNAKCESTHMTICSGSIDSRSWCWRMKIKIDRSLGLFLKDIAMTSYVESSWSRPLKLCRK